MHTPQLQSPPPPLEPAASSPGPPIQAEDPQGHLGSRYMSGGSPLPVYMGMRPFSKCMWSLVTIITKNSFLLLVLLCETCSGLSTAVNKSCVGCTPPHFAAWSINFCLKPSALTSEIHSLPCVNCAVSSICSHFFCPRHFSLLLTIVLTQSSDLVSLPLLLERHYVYITSALSKVGCLHFYRVLCFTSIIADISVF